MHYKKFKKAEDQTLDLINKMIVKWEDCWPEGYFVKVNDLCTDDDDDGYYSGYDIFISKGKRVVNELTIMVVVNDSVFFDPERLGHHLDFVFYQSIYRLVA